MKVKVNRDSCIGCGACAAICDDVFEIDDVMIDGIGIGGPCCCNGIPV